MAKRDLAMSFHRWKAKHPKTTALTSKMLHTWGGDFDVGVQCYLPSKEVNIFLHYSSENCAINAVKLSIGPSQTGAL